MELLTILWRLSFFEVKIKKNGDLTTWAWQACTKKAGYVNTVRTVWIIKFSGCHVIHCHIIWCPYIPLWVNNFSIFSFHYSVTNFAIWSHTKDSSSNSFISLGMVIKAVAFKKYSCKIDLDFFGEVGYYCSHYFC